MMEWWQIFSYLLTNELRLIVGCYFVAKLMDFVLNRKLMVLSIGVGGLVTILKIVELPDIGIMTVESIVLTVIIWYYYHISSRLCLFLLFYYEIGVGLWEFLVSSGLGVLFRSTKFINNNSTEYYISIWLVRLFMVLVAVLFVKQKNGGEKKSIRLISLIAILGMFGVISLSQQSILLLSDHKLTTWNILSIILLFAILLYRLNLQYETEAELAKLKQEQSEILERDYQTLSKVYTGNAKLYHDLHNHIETIYQCLRQGDLDIAIRYCEELRVPIREISQTIWTGDKTIDYLISSKIAMAEKMQIRTKVNIEFPYNTNILNVDLTTILGNLLDNALEAVETASEELRFLNLTIRRINEMLIIKVVNGCGKAPVKQEGKFLTSKKDKIFHGWGIKSILAAVEHYDGVMDTDYSNGVFQSTITLFYHPIQRK